MIETTEIDGVLIKKFIGKTGPFVIDIPVFRSMDGFTDEMRQFNYTLALWKERKAFHEHHSQDDEWFFDGGEAVVVLYDGRISSPTYLQKIRIKVSGDCLIVIRIPRGVLHGYTVLSENCTLFYNVNNEYNPAPEKIDEKTTPYDAEHINFDWDKLEFKVLCVKKTSGKKWF